MSFESEQSVVTTPSDMREETMTPNIYTENARKVRTRTSEHSWSSTDSFTPKSERVPKYLVSIDIEYWEPVLVEDKLVISGFTAGIQTDRTIQTRISSLIFKSNDGTICSLIGPIKNRLKETPQIILNQFKYPCQLKNGEISYKDGIPENWYKIIPTWMEYNKSEIKTNFPWNEKLNQEINDLKKCDGIRKEINIPDIPKVKLRIWNKFLKYKNMIQKDKLLASMYSDTESDSEVIKTKYKNNIEQSLLNKRTSWYINNLIPSLGDTPASNSPDRPEPPDVAKTTVSIQTEITLKDINNINIINKVVSPTPSAISFRSNRNEELNSDSDLTEFFDHIPANSTQIQRAKTPSQLNETCKNINYICSKTLEKFAKRPEISTINNIITENNNGMEIEDIDIDVFSQTFYPNKINNNCTEPTSELISNSSDTSENKKGKKRKSNVLDEPQTSPNVSIRCSLRKRKKLNYKEILFSRITVPPESLIIPTKQRRSNPSTQNKPNIKIKYDLKLFRKCCVLLERENLEIKKLKLCKKTEEKPQKENIQQQQPQQPEHIFKRPLDVPLSIPRKPSKKRFNKTFHLPNSMPKINRKLSLPASSLDMWQIIKCRSTKPADVETAPSIASDVSTDSSDKKRRKLFSPDNWMQSDGCLKTLSQNRYESGDDARFSIRFDHDVSLDSELSDFSCKLK